MKYITRAEIETMLANWMASKVSEVELHEWAIAKQNEVMLDQVDFNDYEDNDNSVAKEVLQILESMDMNLLIKEDVPALMEFLKSPSGKFSEGLDRWEKQSQQIDFKELKEKLKSIPFYSKFCNE